MGILVGIDEEKVHQDIENYTEVTTHSITLFVNACTYLFDSLKEKWASDAAEEKSVNWCNRLAEIATHLRNDSVVTIDKLEDAAVKLAASIGGSYTRINSDIQMNQTLGESDFSSLYLLKEINGSQVMDVGAVNEIMRSFNILISNAIESFDDIPSILGISTEDGATSLTMIENRIEQIKEEAKDTIDTVTKEINECIEEYTTNVTQAVANATETIK